MERWVREIIGVCRQLLQIRLSWTPWGMPYEWGRMLPILLYFPVPDRAMPGVGWKSRVVLKRAGDLVQPELNLDLNSDGY